MAEQLSVNTDTVTLRIGGSDLQIAEGFQINQSILKQPCEFQMRIGRGSIEKNPRLGPTIIDAIRDIPPRTSFQLFINDKLQMTGTTDGYKASAVGGGPTELTIFGRDYLADLHDAHIQQDKSFNDATYKSLVETVLKLVGYKNFTVDTSGSKQIADRKLKAGVKISELLPVRTVAEILANVGGDAQTAGAGSQHSSLQAKFGERWMDFLRKQLDRAGLFLWASADGNFILSQPNTNLAPTYRIVRRRGQYRNEVNVIHAELSNDMRPRSSYVVVYGKHGGRRSGVQKSKGSAQDDEMLQYGYNLNRAVTIRDKYCQNEVQAAYLGQRKLAEGRRHGFQLVYTVSGLSTTAINGGQAVWTPDTTVEILDDEFGINENTPGGNVFWIDEVQRSRMPHTTTSLHLMRPYDVVFGTPDFEGASSVVTGFPKTPKVRIVAEILDSHYVRKPSDKYP